VPLVKGIDPPAELFEIDAAKIVGLKIDAKRLAEIRKNRSRRMGGSNHKYSKLLEVYEELEQAEAVQRRLGCPVIDTTELSIEETAARVIRLVEQRQAEVASSSAE
jgi:regulator of PEP synthase PpsR (kinase-PPPase family)